MTVKDGIEIAMLLIMAGGLFVVHSNRRMLRRGIGVRVIQFLAVAFLLPAIVILSLEGKLGNESTGTLLGAIVGYILSGIGKDEPSEPRD